ncbi:MAG: hypothetical protein ACE5FH_09660, partial [Candidatus Zixiibacteriota bacterium]
QAITWADFQFVNYLASSLDRVYFATTKGIIRYNKLEHQWELPLTGTAGPPEENILRVWVDDFDERLVVQTATGLWENDLSFGDWYGITDMPSLVNDSRHLRPPAVMFPPPGYNYIGDGSLVDEYSRNISISDVLDDGAGNLWMGTWGAGPAQAGTVSNMIEMRPYGLLQNRVNAMALRESMLYVSGAVFDSPRTGISILDLQTMRFDYIESGVRRDFLQADVNCLEVDDSLLYIGTSDGLFLYDLESQEIERKIVSQSLLAEDNVISLCKVGDSLFVGTAYGLSMLGLVGDTTRWLFPSQFREHVIYDLEHVDSSLWIASDNGAFRIKLNSGRLQQYQDPHLVLFNSVYDIERFTDQLWFLGTSGLLKLDMSSGQSTPYRSEIQTIGARALAVNQSVAAVASSNGMALLYYSRRRPVSRMFTSDDGLPSNAAYSLLFDGDYLWVGTDKGLSRFWWNNPDRND